MIYYTINYSLEHRTKITIMYYNDSQISQRSIKVISISSGSIKAYCYSKNAVRTFKIDNILAAVIPDRVINYKTAINS